MPSFELDMNQTAAIACLALLLGRVISNRVSFFKTYCIPDPVVGGLIFAILHTIIRAAGIGEFSLNTTLQTFFMLTFYTTIGFTASFALLKKGGMLVLIFLALSVGMCVLQDLAGAGIAGIFGLDARYGLVTGSIPMVGGHATAAAFGPVIEAEGVFGAEAVAVASATFGLVAGCLIGGPIATRRVRQYNLKSSETPPVDEPTAQKVLEGTPANEINATRFLNAMIILLLATGLGTIITKLLGNLSIMGRPFTFPATIGGLVAGAIFRNFADGFKIKLPQEEIDTIGNYSLMVFLGIAMINLKLWQLADLAVPMVVMLLGQTVLMFLVAYFVIFNAMGRNYDAAVMTTGFCGFGMGASPNAMANMQSLEAKYGPSPTAIFVVSMVAALFVDFFNAIVITVFMNVFA